MTANSAPGFKQYPGHRIRTKPADVRIQVTYKGEVIADTSEAVVMEEPLRGSTIAPVVYYIPRKDVKMDKLKPSPHHTYCPFKGQASYFSLKNGPENSVWTYEQPYEEMSAIQDMLAFYPEKVDSITTGPK